MVNGVCKYGKICTNGSMKFLKCNKNGFACVVSRFCTECGKIKMLDDFKNKCKIRKYEVNQLEENKELVSEVIEQEKNIKEETHIEENKINETKEIKEEKHKKNKKQETNIINCNVIMNNDNKIVVDFYGRSISFIKDKQYEIDKYNKIKVEYTGEIGTKDFIIKLK